MTFLLRTCLSRTPVAQSINHSDPRNASCRLLRPCRLIKMAAPERLLTQSSSATRKTRKKIVVCYSKARGKKSSSATRKSGKRIVVCYSEVRKENRRLLLDRKEKELQNTVVCSRLVLLCAPNNGSARDRERTPVSICRFSRRRIQIELLADVFRCLGTNCP